MKLKFVLRARLPNALDRPGGEVQLPIRLVLSRSMRSLQTTQRAPSVQLSCQPAQIPVRKSRCRPLYKLENFRLMAVNNCYPTSVRITTNATDFTCSVCGSLILTLALFLQLYLFRVVQAFCTSNKSCNGICTDDLLSGKRQAQW